MNENLKSVITCDLDGKIETFSEGAQQLFGYTENEIVGKGRVSDFSAGQIVLGHVVNWLAESVEKGKWEGETVFLHKDGHEMPCKIKITPTKDKEGNQLPNGIYTLLVTANDKRGNTINSSTNMVSSVDGVFTKDGANMLDVGCISIPLDQVISVNRKE